MSVKIKDINVDKVLRITTRCRVINTQDHIIKDHLASTVSRLVVNILSKPSPNINCHP